MKVIFLDIDGVLNTIEYIGRRRELGISGHDENGVSLFDPVMIERLNEIIIATNAKIVISSCWRMLYTINELRNIWRERNILGEIIDTTSVGSMRERGIEIREWLDEHENKIDSYVILDDDSDMLPSQFKNLILTNWKTGMNDEHVRKAIKTLNDKYR